MQTETWQKAQEECKFPTGMLYKELKGNCANVPWRKAVATWLGHVCFIHFLDGMPQKVEHEGNDKKIWIAK